MPGGPLTLFLVTKTEIQEEFRGDIEIRLDKTKSTLQISYRCLDHKKIFGGIKYQIVFYEWKI